MTHEKGFAEQEIEEIAEEVWNLAEQGRDDVGEFRRATTLPDPDVLLRRFVDLALATLDGNRIVLTPSGKELAERQVRRHRLAELLLSTVFEVEDNRAMEGAACMMEHALGSAVTDSVCAFLGHPKFCPHGKPIPAGACCRAFSLAIEPLVQPLSRMAVGSEARVVYIVPKDPERLVRLSSLGLVPGATIRLQQRQPAAVVRIGETTLALDPVIATEIYVKRTAP